MKFSKIMESVPRDDGIHVGAASPLDFGAGNEEQAFPCGREEEYVIWRVARRTLDSTADGDELEDVLRTATAAFVNELEEIAPTFIAKWRTRGARRAGADRRTLTKEGQRRCKALRTKMKQFMQEGTERGAYGTTLTRDGFVTTIGHDDATFGHVRIFRRCFEVEDLWGIVRTLLMDGDEVAGSEDGRPVFQTVEGGRAKPAEGRKERMQARLSGSGEQLASFVKARLIERGVISRDAVAADEVTVLWNAAKTMPRQAFHSDYGAQEHGFSVITPLDGAIPLSLLPLRPRDENDRLCVAILQPGDVVVFAGDVNHAGTPGLGCVPCRRLHVYLRFPPPGGTVEPGQVIPRHEESGLRTHPTTFSTGTKKRAPETSTKKTPASKKKKTSAPKSKRSRR